MKNIISWWYTTSDGFVFIFPESSQTSSPTWEPKIKGPLLFKRLLFSSK